MLSNIKESGPGFKYFLNTLCQDWDMDNYLEALKDCNLNKATITRSFNKQLQRRCRMSRRSSQSTHGTASSHGYGLRLRCWLRLIHGTASSHGYGLRLRRSQLTESRTTGRIHNFWLKYNNDFTRHEKMKVNSTFLSCDGVQIGCIGNNIQIPSIEEETSTIPTKRVRSTPFPSTNVQRTSTIPNSNDVKTKEPEADEEIKFDLVNVSMELNREPTVKWEVGSIDITGRFRKYQKDVFQKAVRQGFKYENVYELLALSSIMVLCWPFPYPMFTSKEWKDITKTNPYTMSEPSLPAEISSSLRDTASKHLIGGDVFMERGKTELNKMVALMLNDLYCCIPDVAPSKLFEEEHCNIFIYPISRSFNKSEKDYKLKLNRANANSKIRPDLI
ncbi:6129_t:CDS:2 [Acaulospora morrowiae]|uniref:6129_t:CDS:1 n=1 Tax=Acaulospora morrowiae TaxID=94023 RepID=A0A9N9A6K1_9GLOM|nr:6129_t:CDS:2 [Acaulospora morrowiae]